MWPHRPWTPQSTSMPGIMHAASTEHQRRLSMAQGVVASIPVPDSARLSPFIAYSKRAHDVSPLGGNTGGMC